jgi:outer membrane protein OmpA-like peptidoglycan-associated protein
MWWKQEKSIFSLAIASLTIWLLVGGVWYCNEKKVQTPPTSKTNNFAQLTVSNALEKNSITLLGDSFSGYSTFRNSEFRKALSELGIDLKYEEEFDQNKRAERLNQNNADIYVTTLDQFLLQKPQGKIVGLVDRTVGADAIVLNTKKYPFLKSVQSLEKLEKGKKIVYAGDTPSEYLSMVLDTNFEVFDRSKLVSKPVVDASDAWKLLQAKNADVAVAVLWEPYVSKARSTGYTVALSSRDAPTAIVDVIVASDRLIASNPQIVSDFLELYYRHIDRLHREPDLLNTQIATDGNLSVAEAQSVVNGIDFLTSVEVRQWMSDGTLTKRLGATAAVLALSGKIEQIPKSFQALYDPRFVERAVENTERLIELVRADNPVLADKLSGRGKEDKSAIADYEEVNSEIGNLQIQGTIEFKTESAYLTALGRQTLVQLASKLEEFNPDTVAVEVIGHTSKTGSSDFNKALSSRRAQTVAQALKNAGVKLEIVALGKGDSAPLPGIKPKDFRQQRTEIRLIRK